jgi:D-threo-aldose 1-dehydrogenase
MASVLGTNKQGDHQLSSSGAAGSAGGALPGLALRDLQKSPLRIADLMLGCAFNTVSDNRDGLMAAAEQDAIAAVAAAVELGIHEMDVSASYGQGRSEEYVGSGLIAAGVPSGPSWINVWSKGGPELIRQKDDPTQTVGRGYAGDRVNLRDFSAGGARAAFAESTARLGLERLAGFRIHDPSPEDVDTALGPDGFVAGLVAMRNEGLIGEVSLGELIVLFSLLLCVALSCLTLCLNAGMNSNRPEVARDIMRFLKEAPVGTFNSFLLAGGWNLLNQDSFPIMVEAAQRGVAIHNAGIFNTGLLVGGVTYAYVTAWPGLLS